MGMTIKEAIKYYENKNVVLTEEEALANTLALNTMRKYQKIQEIVAKWEEEVHSGVSCSFDRMEYIKEVLEGGNDN